MELVKRARSGEMLMSRDCTERLGEEIERDKRGSRERGVVVWLS